MSRPPVFSLILATVGRTDELRTFVESLARQTLLDVELIVVDQNDDDRLVPLLAPVRSLMTVRHIRSPRGLSRARNNGLALATGSIVAFPDDDCWYAPDLLEQVRERFEAHTDIDGWTGMTRDADGRPSGSRWTALPGRITRATVWTMAVSTAIFLRRSAAASIGKFNESLGVGAGTIWGSGEETDYVLRGLALDLRLMYDPAIVVHHPQVEAFRDRATRSRGVSYGMGYGWVLRQHRFSKAQVMYHCLRPIGGMIVALARGRLDRAHFSWNVARGRIRGYLTATPLT